MAVRGIRGAITVGENDREAILEGTRELLQAMVDANGVEVDDIASCHFTTSPDLNAEFPAEATRRLEGWKYVPLLCGHEMNVPGAMPKCVRIKEPQQLVFVVITGFGRELLHSVYEWEQKKWGRGRSEREKQLEASDQHHSTY